MKELDLQGQPLNLDLTLACGQSFRWRKHEDGVWRGVVRDKLVELSVENNTLLWSTHPEEDEELVRDYLRLGDGVNYIYSQLACADPYIAGLIDRFRGLRLLRQDPTETLFSFVCSTVNSIPRISAAVEALSRFYGELVCVLTHHPKSTIRRDGDKMDFPFREESVAKGGICYYASPTIFRLAQADSVALAKTGCLEFRGFNLKSVAEQLIEKGENWLTSLRDLCYEQARDELLTIKGIGRKIADCVCLFSLDKDEAVPVDTHVLRIALRLWLPQMAGKSLTDTLYRRIAEEFRARYGRLAGWAQQFLYYEDLLRGRTT
ncbi:MAG: hypothetical protein N3B12_02900 [Armatimonadetes bacterium]|nr:hypothetical protein [Armatimonadota bacterium]